MKNLIALLALLTAVALTGCGSNSNALDELFGADTANEIEITGDGNTVTLQRGDTIAPPPALPTPEPTATPAPDEAGMPWVLVLVLASVAFGGCVNSSVSWSPTLSVYNRGGTVGNPTAMDGGATDAETLIEQSGGADVAAEVAAP